jgi:hypothetical protein
MEWLDQTRRINKSVDMICMETIDGIVKAIRYVDRRVIYRNKKFFERFCTYYHKPNPVNIIRQIKKKDMSPCHSCHKDQNATKILSEYVQGSINRCWTGIDMVQTQWFEIIDFMFEMPQLVNPNAIDEYIAGRITEVCRNNRKLNPLANGTAKRFGRYWRDKDGKWRQEKRRRF